MTCKLKINTIHRGILDLIDGNRLDRNTLRTSKEEGLISNPLYSKIIENIVVELLLREILRYAYQ